MDEHEREPHDLEFTTARVRRFARFAFIWAAIVLVRLVQLQIVEHNKYQLLADREHDHLVKVEPRRGSILDRNGQRLAMSLPVDSVFVNPMQIRDSGVAAEILGKLLDLDAPKLKADIDEAAAAHRGFLWVKRRLEPEDADRLRSLHLDWIGFEHESQRFYPYDELAAHVLGSMSNDDRALEGVELKLNDELAAKPGFVRVSADVRQKGYAQEDASTPAQRGDDIRLTIDSRIQYIAERELKRTVIDHRCWTGSLVVMNPNTGRDSRAGQLPDLRSEQAAAERRRSARAFQQRVFRSFRARLRVQGGHPERRAGDHESHARHRHSLLQRRVQVLRPRDSRPRSLQRAAHVPSAGAFEQHRRDPDRHQGRQGQTVRLRQALRLRPEDRRPAARRNARPDPPSRKVEQDLDRVHLHGSRNR